MSFNSGTDQAAGLRRMLEQRHDMRYIAFLSAIPAVHKNALLLNLATALSQKGVAVHILDTSHDEHGIANHVHCHPKQWLFDQEGHATGLELHISAPGVTVSRLSQVAINQFADNNSLLGEISDVLKTINADQTLCLIDLLPDNDNPLSLPALANAEIVVLTTPNPEHIKQAYLHIKTLHSLVGKRSFQLLVLDANSQQAALIQQNLTHACKIFLSLPIQMLGYMTPDRSFEIAALRGQSIFELFPSSSTANRCRSLADKLTADSTESSAATESSQQPETPVGEPQNV